MLCIGMICMENERGKEEHCLPALQQALYSMDGKVVSSEIDQLRHDRESGFFCGAPHRPVRHRSRSHHILRYHYFESSLVREKDPPRDYCSLALLASRPRDEFRCCLPRPYRKCPSTWSGASDDWVLLYLHMWHRELEFGLPAGETTIVTLQRYVRDRRPSCELPPTFRSSLDMLFFFIALP
jgi:hypothetical protein